MKHAASVRATAPVPTIPIARCAMDVRDRAEIGGFLRGIAAKIPLTSMLSSAFRSASRGTRGCRCIHILRTVPEYRTWRQQQEGDVGFVPTMGALHPGHLSLVGASSEANSATVASIFVNPLQFAPHEDFDRYPRRVERDVELLASRGVSAVFVPDAREMYASKRPAQVVIPDIDTIAEGAARPGFFR